MTEQLARGIICHSALEEVFDLRPEERTLENLSNLFRREWRKHRVGDESGHGEDSGRASGGTKDEGYGTLFRTFDRDDDVGDDRGDKNSHYDVEAEIEWGKSSLRLLQNYYELEDPKLIRTPNPAATEMWVNARFPLEGSSNDRLDGGRLDNTEDSTFVVRGKIDRIDLSPLTTSNKVQLQIIDYKTGKKPNFKYSPAVNERIENEQFWKMKVYALVLWKMIQQTDKNNAIYHANYQTSDYSGQEKDKQDYTFGLSWLFQQKILQAVDNTNQKNINWSNILELSSLRLMFLTSHLDDVSTNNPTILANSNDNIIGKATILDYPLGSNPAGFESILDQTEREIQSLARGIKQLVEMQDPLAFKHCDWKYCSCHELRGRFRRGTVWMDEC